MCARECGCTLVELQGGVPDRTGVCAVDSGRGRVRGAAE